MKKTFERQTIHYQERSNERFNVKNEKEGARLVSLALERGKRSVDCKYSFDRKYLNRRSTGGCTAIAYDGKCFIIDARNICVTVYGLPKQFGANYIEREEHMPFIGWTYDEEDYVV